jgi:hypothetical protein
MSHSLPSTLPDDQENLFSPYSTTSRYSSRGSASARQWEEVLDEAVTQTDNNLEKLIEMKMPKQKQLSVSLSEQNFPLRSGSKARSVSASRLSTSALLEQKEFDLSAAAAMERKVDFLFRRTKLLDEKQRSAEKDRLDNRNFAHDTMNAIKHLADAQAADQKQILALRENIVHLKEDLEVLRKAKDMASIEIRTPQTSAAEVERITESVKGHFKSTMKDVVQSCAAEQARFMAKWTEKANAESDRMRSESHHETEALSTVEKEVQRMITDISRLKGRQDSLDGSYHSLQSTVAVREKRAEEAHKKAISFYKQEMGTVMDTVGKRMNEYLTLNMSHGGEKSEVFEKQTQALARRLDATDSMFRELSNKVQSCSKMSSEALLMATDMQIKEANTALSGPVESQGASSFERTVHQLRAELGEVKSSCNEYQSSSSIAFESVTDSHRKIKSKLNELSTSMSTVSRIREAVDSLLQEVHLKTNTAEPADLKNTIIGIHARLTVLESAPKQIIVEATEQMESKRDREKEEKGNRLFFESQTLTLKEQIAQEMVQMQGDIEDAVKSGWADIITRQSKLTQDGAKLGEVVQRLQGVVLNMQADERGLGDRIEALEELSTLSAPPKGSVPPGLDTIEDPIIDPRQLSKRPPAFSPPKVSLIPRKGSKRSSKSVLALDSPKGPKEGSKGDYSSPSRESRDPGSAIQNPTSPVVVHVHAVRSGSSRSSFNGSLLGNDTDEEARVNSRMATSHTDTDRSQYANMPPIKQEPSYISSPISLNKSSGRDRDRDRGTGTGSAVGPSDTLTARTALDPAAAKTQTNTHTRESFIDKARTEEWERRKLDGGSSNVIPARSPDKAPSPYPKNTVSSLFPVPFDDETDSMTSIHVSDDDSERTPINADDEAEKNLFLKKSQHRSRFLKSVLSSR